MNPHKTYVKEFVNLTEAIKTLLRCEDLNTDGYIAETTFYIPPNEKGQKYIITIKVWKK